MLKILPTLINNLWFTVRRPVTPLINSSPLNKSGFTLIELLVVIAIIAILAVVGIAVFGGQQRNARDARRRADIHAISQALEANKPANSATYVALAIAQFANGAIPQDTTTAQYCAAAVAAGGTLAVIPTIWASGSACPTTPAGYTSITAATPPIGVTTVAWRVCALLENGSNPGNIFCLPNTQ